MTLMLQTKLSLLAGVDNVSHYPLEPYAPLVCEFLHHLSTELFADKRLIAYPDIMAFAFWCRKAHLSQLKQEFSEQHVRLGLGCVFHIAPSNVPVNFAYSYVFGLLAGNANVVRVPSKSFDQVEIICRTIAQLFQQRKYAQIKKMSSFVRYERDDEITAMFSSDCHARVIWGGDKAIQQIRSIPLPARSIEITFADRYSFCLLDGQAIEELSDKALGLLAKNFYNDTYLMDQNACSSPHLVLWHGKASVAAKEKFWDAVGRVVKEQYSLLDIMSADKYLQFCQDAIKFEGECRVEKKNNDVYRCALNRLPASIDSLRGKYGYFYEYDLKMLDELISRVTGKCQTLTYFGVDAVRLRDFMVKKQAAGIDRIVPVGKALDIGVIWDGYDLVKSLSRIIYME